MKLGTRRTLTIGVSLVAVASLVTAGSAVTAGAAVGGTETAAGADHGHGHGSDGRTATPIKHVVVIFDENISFDHYFATYPKAANTDGTRFTASRRTPRANNLLNTGLLTRNPNLYQPFRLSPSEAATCDQNHNYLPEQQAANGGKNDKYVQYVSVDTCTGGLFQAPGLTMGYFDGNTVTAMWNYAQQFALNDNSFGSAYGPSSPGAIELVSGQTHGIQAVDPNTGVVVSDSYAVVAPDANKVGTMINDPDPYYDDCSNKNRTATNNLAKFLGRNVGDLLNAKGITWGWFQGGFKATTKYAGAGSYAVCGATHENLVGASVVDYSPHHNPFSYYASTANPHHLAPTSTAAIGHTDRANHNYDLTDFDQAIAAGNLPSVSYLKAPEYQDGHAGYSDPINEQHFLIKEINEIQSSKFWKDTAIVIAYDDSDGWYDHQSARLQNGSTDETYNAAACVAAASRVGVAGGYQDRCGPGTRHPLLVLSPYARSNAIDHTLTEQTSILRFVEDNWGLGRIGDHSFDARAKSLTSMFDFRQPFGRQVLLKADGSVKSVRPVCNLHWWWWSPCH